jgi:hypothetical protein
MIIKFILCELNECERDKPIKKGTQCLSTYCSNSQFDSGQCIVSNPIIKTQWLNNIILVGEKDYRYIGFITSSKWNYFYQHLLIQLVEVEYFLE